MTSRTDQENQELLRRLRPQYDKLREEEIRARTDVERSERDLAEAKAEALRLYGTDDVAQLKAIVEERRARNTERLDAFASAVRTVASELAEISEAR